MADLQGPEGENIIPSRGSPSRRSARHNVTREQPARVESASIYSSTASDVASPADRPPPPHGNVVLPSHNNDIVPGRNGGHLAIRNNVVLSNGSTVGTEPSGDHITMNTTLPEITANGNLMTDMPEHGTPDANMEIDQDIWDPALGLTENDAWDLSWAVNEIGDQSMPAWWMVQEGDFMLNPPLELDSAMSIGMQDSTTHSMASLSSDTQRLRRTMETNTAPATELRMSVGERSSLSQQLQPVDHNVVLTECFGHIDTHFPAQHAEIVAYQTHQQRSMALGPLDDRVFHAFIELYFEYFQCQFPFIHPATLSSHTPWLLLLAVAAVGAQYSTISNAAKWATTLRDLLRHAIKELLPPRPDPGDLSFTQAVLLLEILVLFAEGQDSQVAWQYDKGILVTLFHALSRDSKQANSTRQLQPRDAPLATSWHHWLQSESRMRLLHCIYRFQCLELILLDRRPGNDLSDVRLQAPCQEDVWSCRNATEWAKFRPPLTNVHSDGLDNSDSRPDLGSLTKSDRIMSVYVEERMLLSNMRSPALQTILLAAVHSLGTTPCVSEAPQEQARQKALTTSITAYFDQEFKADSHILDHCSQDAQTADPLPLVLLILRKLPLRTLYVFSGWQADNLQIEKSRAHLKSWMYRNKSSARSCLWYSSQVFGMLRVKSQFACYDALCLLVSGLYMWAFDLIMHVGTPCHAQTTPSAASQSKPVVRLDRSSNRQHISSWLDGDIEARIHVTGVGMMTGHASAQRVLIAMRSILLSCTAWSGHTKGLAATIKHIIEGRRPTLDV